MAIIVKFLLLLTAYHSGKIVTSQPLNRGEQTSGMFQRNYHHRLKDVIFFPDSQYINQESHTEDIALNRPQTESGQNLKIRNNHNLPQIQDKEIETTTESKMDCAIFNVTECAEYYKLINDIFRNIDATDIKKDNSKNNFTNVKYDKLIERNNFKSVSDNVIISEIETTTDVDMTTIADGISYRGPPAAIVASLLG